MLKIKLFSAKLVSKILTAVFTALFTVTSFSMPSGQEPPKAPEDFTPVLRFAVCSDVHLDGDSEQRNAKEFSELFTQSYEYSRKSKSYKNLDAVVVCGDMTEWGREIEYQSYKNIIDKNLKKGTEVLSCMGNHEFIEAREVEGVDPLKNYREYVSEEFDTHKVINGYHFIGISYSDKDENFDKSKMEWLRQQLDIAVADTGDKPVFVYQHPHPALTVFGSINWANIATRKVLSKYPQVISFSGHSHYAPTDPRSIWQGSFTAMGTGAITGLISNTNYLDGGSSSTVDSASYSIVEADANGNVRVQIFDAQQNMFYPEGEYYLTGITDRSSHFYNWKNLKSLDTKPAFPEGAEITVAKNEKGEAVITFPEAKGYYDAVSYDITAEGAEGTVFASSAVSNYLLADNKDMQVNLGALPDGEYRIRIVPVSPYAKYGKALTATVTTV